MKGLSVYEASNLVFLKFTKSDTPQYFEAENR